MLPLTGRSMRRGKMQLAELGHITREIGGKCFSSVLKLDEVEP